MLGQATPRLVTRRLIALPGLDQSLLRQLTAALLAAALAETLLLRLVTRVGVHLPKDEAVRGAFHAATLLGSLAFNFASVLAIALVAILLGALALRLGTIGRLALVAVSVSMFAGLAASLATNAPAADALFGASITVLVAILGLALVTRGDTPPAARAALALIVAAYFCYQYYTLSYLGYRLLDYPAIPPLSTAALRAGEGLVVVAGGAVFLGWGLERWRRVGLIGGVAVLGALAVLALAWLSPTSTPSILALWTTGLSLYLPIPIYLLSLGLYLVTLVACWRGGDGFWAAAGLLLILLAGYMPEATYHHLLLLVGVACLSGAIRAGVPTPTARATDDALATLG